ncbi:MAG: putative cardiolipin synthase [Halioglobus sp.]|jgi:putative cardiolipin synthase
MYKKLYASITRWSLSHLLMVIGVSLASSACVSMPPNTQLPQSTAYTDTKNTKIGSAVVEAVAVNNNQTGVLLLNTGLNAFGARVALAKAAQRSLDVQYYLFHRDLSGRLLLDQLLQAADRGVRVRLLVDDMDMADTDLGVAVLDAHPNMEVRLFNPFARDRSRLGQYISRFGSVTRRMHNKSFTADNQMTIIGGRNVGDEYFGADPSVSFADMDVLLAGTAVQEVSTSFDLYWNSELSYRVSSLGEKAPTEVAVQQARKNLNNWVSQQQNSVYVKSLKNSSLALAIENQSINYQWAEVKIFYDQPNKISSNRDRKDLNMSQYIAPYFEHAKHEILVISPYFVPGKAGTKMLCDIHKRGVRISVLTNSLASTDVAVVHAGYLRYRKKLLQCGIELYEANSKVVMRDTGSQEYKIESDDKKEKLGLSRSSLHAKMFVFDRRHTFIGSLNLDPRSIVENTEIGSIIESTTVGEAVAGELNSKIPRLAYKLTLDSEGDVIWTGYENGQIITFDVEPDTDFMRRLTTQIMRFMPIESQI